MEEETLADTNEEVLPADTQPQTEEVVTTTETVEQDPLETELEKVQAKKRTKTEKLLYSKKRIDEQLKELGIEDEVEDDEDKPVTMGMLKKLQEQSSTKSALQMADEVTSSSERELLKYHLENTIRPSGDAKEDFKLAQGLVNAVKNNQIIEETIRKVTPKSHSSGSGAPANIEKPVEFTSEELAFMKPPFNLSKEKILEARKAGQ